MHVGKHRLALALLPIAALGALAYYWFDVGGRIKSEPLVTISASQSAETDALSQTTMTQNQNSAGQYTEYAYLAGGCFWCVEKDLEKLAGVGEVLSGYSGGQSESPTYQNHRGHREAVRVAYDPAQISYAQLLHHFFRHHDGTDAGGSFYDRGHSYTSAIFYQNPQEEATARQVKQDLDASGIFESPLVTAIEPLKNFTIAEDYHQDYYKKNPISAAKYRAYRAASGRDRFIASVAAREQEKAAEQSAAEVGETAEVDEADNVGDADHPWFGYQKPTDEELRKRLTPLQYRVTQQDGTERPFSTGNLNDEKREGIFVDIVSGEPLFSSRDKFDSGTGWPSFTRAIDEEFITTSTDYWLIYPRTEVRSAFADSHLGHVFNDGPKTHNGQESTGQRWCINGAALRFVPLEDMAAEGYGEYVGAIEGGGGG